MIPPFLNPINLIVCCGTLLTGPLGAEVVSTGTEVFAGTNIVLSIG
jgi:hypothetical protein